MWTETLCPRCEELEEAFTRPRVESMVLILTGRATEQRLKQLEEEEVAARWVIIDHRIADHQN
jgi:hypothetical protein